MTFKFGKHDCNKDYCNLCKEMVSFDHECFIKVVPKELEVELDEEEQPIHIQALEQNTHLNILREEDV